MAVDGKPSVTVPKLNERAVQDSVLAIRQRLAVLDAAVRVLQNTGSNQQTIANLQTQLAVLQNQVNLISGGIFLAQNPNLFFAGPIEGSASTPDFRLIDWLDLPPVADLPPPACALSSSSRPKILPKMFPRMLIGLVSKCAGGADRHLTAQLAKRCNRKDAHALAKSGAAR